MRGKDFTKTEQKQKRRLGQRFSTSASSKKSVFSERLASDLSLESRLLTRKPYQEQIGLRVE